MISGSMNYIKEILRKLVQNKKETLFSDQYLMKEVLSGLRTIQNK